jgi:hypothetical protein
MKSSINKIDSEPDVYKAKTRAEINQSTMIVAMVVIIVTLIISSMLDTIKMTNVSQALVDAQLKRNLIVVETSKGQLESIEKLPESVVLDYAESFVTNIMDSDVKTYAVNHAYARKKLNSSYDISLSSFFDKWEASMRANAITQDWKRSKVQVRPNEDGSNTYRITGSYNAWAGTASYASGEEYVEVDIVRTEVTQSTPLGIEISRVDLPMMRGSR